jgi:hypothetical protein
VRVPADPAFLRHDALLNPGRTLGVLTDLRHALEPIDVPTPVDLMLGGHSLVALLMVAIRDAQLLDLQSRTEAETRISQEDDGGR